MTYEVRKWHAAWAVTWAVIAQHMRDFLSGTDYALVAERYTQAT
jgi:hypothetical protein